MSPVTETKGGSSEKPAECRVHVETPTDVQEIDKLKGRVGETDRPLSNFHPWVMYLEPEQRSQFSFSELGPRHDYSPRLDFLPHSAPWLSLLESKATVYITYFSQGRWDLSWFFPLQPPIERYQLTPLSNIYSPTYYVTNPLMRVGTNISSTYTVSFNIKDKQEKCLNKSNTGREKKS